MAFIELKGDKVAEKLIRNNQEAAVSLRKAGIVPMLAIFRVGPGGSADTYLASACRCAERCGVETKTVSVSPSEGEEGVLAAFSALCDDPSVHGILPMLPLAKPFRALGSRLCALIPPEKDVDGVSPTSLGRLFCGETCFAPCTAEACLELLDGYGLTVSQKRAVVIGRSVVVGKPLAALLLARNATVTVCHSQTENLPAAAREADFVFTATGCRGLVTAEYLKPGAVVVDVGTVWDETAGRLFGDVNFASASAVASALSPVPGGVGAITPSLVIAHTLRAAGA